MEINCKRCGHGKEQHEKVELAMDSPKKEPTVVCKCEIENCDCVDYQ